MAGLPPPPINDKPGSFTWLEWYRQLRNYVSTSGSVPWYIINFTGSNITDIALREHNNLQGVQGGAAGNQYHITASQAANIGDGTHNSISGIQGGTAGQFYHLTQPESTVITNRSYGEMYANNATTTITISVIDTWYPITTGFSGGTNKNMTFQNNHEILCNMAGVYSVQYSLSMEATGTNKDTEYAITVNNVLQNNTTTHSHFQTANSEVCVASGGILTLAANDVVRLVVRNRTSATDLMMAHGSLTLVRIDN